MLALVALTACGDGQPFFDTSDDGGGVDPVDPPAPGDPGGFDTGTAGAIPAAIIGNLRSVRINPPGPDGEQTITVDIASLDTTPIRATYLRNTELDIPGYSAFSVQEDPLDRMFIALIGTSADGTLQGGVVADGGQFNRFFGGAFYRRIGTYSPHVPVQLNNGLVSYAGNYAGLSNIDAPRPGQILPVPDDTAFNLIPGQPSRVTGRVFLNADFSNNTINGLVYQRELTDVGLALPDVVLIVSDIRTNGTFVGVVENPELGGIGEYAGVFGGTGATSVAGGLAIADYLDDIDNEHEFGIFVISQCGQPGAPSPCEVVRPFP